jgi:site-specific recombinase XerD
MSARAKAKKRVTAGLYRMLGSRFWWYRFSDTNGKRIAVSLKTEDETQAILKKAEIIENVARFGTAAYLPQKPGTGPVHQVDTVIDRYIDEAKNRLKKAMRPRVADNVSGMLKNFCKDSGIINVREVTTGKMETWIKGKKKAGRSTETLRSYSRDLRAWLHWLLDEGHVLNQPMLEMPDAAPVGRRNWIEQTKVNEIIACAFKKPKKGAPEDAPAEPDRDLQFILHAGFDAGFRRKEISEARVEWFNLERGVVDVFSNETFRTKDDDARTIPLKQAFKDFLKEYLKGRESGYVLAPEKKQGASKYRFDPNRRLMSHFRNCGVRCTWHDMRRSFASNLLTKGESIYITASWLGDNVSVVEKSYGFLGLGAGNIDR